MQGPFRGRKGSCTHNVMAAVDFDLKFTYVLAGWEGSAHDALVLFDALERDGGLSVPEGNIVHHSWLLFLKLFLNTIVKQYNTAL